MSDRARVYATLEWADFNTVDRESARRGVKLTETVRLAVWLYAKIVRAGGGQVILRRADGGEIVLADWPK